jgi:hypothetical protein
VPRHITIHGERRLRERGITRDDIEHALNHPIGQPRPGQPGSVWVWGYSVSGETLKVCVSTVDSNIVITAAWPGR